MTDTAAQRITDLAALAAQIDTLPTGVGPTLIAVAGAPGSGKSTLAEHLHALITKPCCVIPMDGHHLDNVQLEEMGLLHRKGAPETFDLPGFRALITALKSGETRHFPTFDRSTDSVVPAGGEIPSGTDILIFEGNYLLFDAPGWADLHPLWDGSVWIDVPRAVLEARLVQRWRDHGMEESAARARALDNDMPNAERVCAHVLPHTWQLVQ